MTIAVSQNDPLVRLAQLEADARKHASGTGGGVGVNQPDPDDPPEGGYDSTPSGYSNDPALSAPANLVLTTGTYYNQNFIDASWTASSNPQVNEYEVELDKAGTGVIRAVRTGATSLRLGDLDPNQQYHIRVRGLNPSTSRSTNYAGPVSITTGTDATIPGQVQGVELWPGFQSVLVEWDENPEEDVKDGKGLYEVQLDTTALFNSVFLKVTRTSALITSFNGLVRGVTYYSRVRAIDSGGNFGPWSIIVSGTTGQARGEDIENGSVNNDHIHASGISADHIKFGSMDGDRITVNTLNANRIETSELNAAIITIRQSGMIRMGRTSAPFHYMLQDESGVRAYRDGGSPFSGGWLTFELNVNTGGAYFSGTIDASVITGGLIRTAVSGTRIELRGQGYGRPGEIALFSGDGNESAYGFIDTFSSGGQLYAQFMGPKISGSGWQPYVQGASGNSSTFGQMLVGVLDGGATQPYVRLQGGNTVMQEWGGNARRLFLRTDYIQLLFGDPNFSPYLHMDSSNFFLRRHDTYIGSASDGVMYLSSPNYGLYFQVRAGSNDIRMITGGWLRMGVHNGAMDMWNRIALNDWEIRFRSWGDGNHMLAYWGGGVDGPIMEGNNLCGIVGWNSDCSFYAQGGALRVYNAPATAYQNIVAAGYLYPSAPTHKENIRPVTESSLEKLRGAKPHRFRYQNDPKRREFLSVMAPDLPEEVTRTMSYGVRPSDDRLSLDTTPAVFVDARALQALIVGALGELADSIDASNAKINEVISKMPASDQPTPI